jgi:hypothetical protein
MNRVAITLDDLLATYRRVFYIVDPDPLIVALAVIVANLGTGAPVWLLIVGPPSSGKTEIVSMLARLPFVHVSDTFTEAGLLWGRIGKKGS